jgi:VIT1/CCC1 family predicted Fe2+/Mn2+ transporter
MHEELGFSKSGGIPPLRSGIAMSLAYVVGAAIPILPYAVIPGRAALAVSVAGTLGALFAVGAWKARLSQRPWWKAGAEMSVAGALGTLACYLIATGIARI